MPYKFNCILLFKQKHAIQMQINQMLTRHQRHESFKMRFIKKVNPQKL